MRKTRRGGSSRCHVQCKKSCSSTCRKLCDVAKRDTSHHKEALSNLLVIKEELKKKLESQSKDKIDKLLNTDQFSEKERTELRHVLEGDLDLSAKKIIFENLKKSSNPFQRGGFHWLSSKSKKSECEVDCSTKCSDSCDYLCNESVNKKASIYKKEMEMVSAEIEVLKSVLTQLVV